jgi:hypothetical protein
MVLPFAAAAAGSRRASWNSRNSSLGISDQGRSPGSGPYIAPHPRVVGPRGCYFFAVTVALTLAGVGSAAFGVTRVILAVENSRERRGGCTAVESSCVPIALESARLKPLSLPIK